MGDPQPLQSPFALARLPIPIPVDATVSPAQGTGQLSWYELPHFPLFGSRIVMRFAATPWSKTGVQPFAWDWVAATGANVTPFLRVAIARGVTVTQAFTGRRGRERPVPAGWSPPTAGLLRGHPIVLLYRPQDDGLIPDPEEAFEPHRIIGQPYVLAPTPSGNLGMDRSRTLQVRPHETGVVIAQHDGGFEVHVTITDLGRPAAFAYDVDPDESLLGTGIRIVHTPDVEVHVRARESFSNFLVVETSERAFQVPGQTTAFPPQGSELPRDRYRFGLHEIDDLVPSRETLLTVALVEVAISLIPYVGVLYDLGQLAYSAATGKSFWGYSVGRGELALMGFTTTLGLAISSVSKIASLRTAARATKLERILEVETLTEIRRVADTGFVEAVGKLSRKQVDGLTAALERHLADPRAMPLATLIDKLNDAIGESYVLSLERRMLAKVFTEDFSGFRHPQLNAAYNKYRSSPRFRRNPELAESPAGWAKRQAAATAGVPRLLLRQALGDDFPGVINRALKQNTVPREVTKLDIDNFDKLVARGVEDYGTLRNLARRMPGFGDLFELDHLLEQRFWRNNPNLVTAFDHEGVGMATIVPKNAAVARDMFARFGGERIRYVHTVKTRMLRELIPSESEAFFTVQEIWDAHVHVLKSLGTHTSLYGEGSRLVENFELMAKELGQTFTWRIPSPDLFLHANGWPRVFRNPDRTWTVIR